MPAARKMNIAQLKLVVLMQKMKPDGTPVLTKSGKEVWESVSCNELQATAVRVHEEAGRTNMTLVDESDADGIRFTYWDPEFTVNVGVPVRLTRAYMTINSYTDKDGNRVAERVINLSREFTEGKYPAPAGKLIKLGGGGAPSGLLVKLVTLMIKSGVDPDAIGVPFTPEERAEMVAIATKEGLL